MKIDQFHNCAAAVACWAMICSPALAAPPAAAIAPADVALADGGLLTGQVVTAQGAAVANAPVVVSAQGREIVRVATNAEGAFAVPGLKGGVYEVSAPGSQGVYRLWAPRTAPPAARHGVMMVSGTETVRGQFGPPPVPPEAPKGPFGKVMGWVSEHPFITAGAIATAIAVPLALDDDDDDVS